MPGLETQVGQIYINNRKLSKSFISLFSEKAAETNAEIYILMEVVAQASGSASEYERILKAIVNVLRRNYKKPNPNAFENSIAQINEDLSNFAGLGQTQWVGKFNACVAVRQNENLAVATAGKIHAYLFREKQFSDIADPGTGKQNPVKTFENFAVGKVAKKDFLIFTTTQLFNYISVERLQKILSDLPIATACKTIGDLIKELADESVSFGTFVVELGAAHDFSPEEAVKNLNVIETKQILSKAKAGLATSLSAAKKFVAHTMLLTRRQKPTRINVQSISSEMLKEQAGRVDPKTQGKNLSRAKKFFFGAAIVFFAALLINIGLAVRLHYKKQNGQQSVNLISDIQSKIDDANAAFIYNDQKTAQDLFRAAKTEFDALPNDKSLADQQNKLSTELTSLQNSIEKVKSVTATELFSFNADANKILLVGRTLYAVNAKGDLFLPYSLASKQQQQNFTISAAPLSEIAAYNQGFVAVDANGNIYQIDPQTQTAVRQPGNTAAGAVGLALYGAPVKLYGIDRQNSRIVTALFNSGAATYMQIGASNPMDLAIDGSIYILYSDKIQKFNSKQPKPFDSGLSFSDNSKIYTDKTMSYVYVLDPGKKRLIVLDKNGTVINQYTSDQFQNLKNFAVDEKNRTAYVINNQSVLSIHF